MAINRFNKSENRTENIFAFTNAVINIYITQKEQPPTITLSALPLGLEPRTL